MKKYTSTLRFVILVLTGLYFQSNTVNANCNFVAGDYLAELSMPESIHSINIKVPKSGKFSENFARILTSKYQAILPEFRKKFKANVTVSYDFGKCTFDASVRQTGDWKDHIQFTEAGEPVRSLKVKLKEGNILNAVSFKLLLPETRNDLNEVLGTVLMRELGFIAPETFQVKTMVNGVSHIMLFQEHARKELLERNGKREAPIFEGDESLIWGSQGNSSIYDPLSLTRMMNDKWFLRGQSSQYLAIHSYGKLQKAYLDYYQDKRSRKDSTIFPNERKNHVFENYFLTMLAMYGHHGLGKLNRRFYYNPFEQQFEPIYYDGDFRLHSPMHHKNDRIILQIAFFKEFKYNYKNEFLHFTVSSEAFIQFKNRVLVSDNDAKYFYQRAISQISKNVEKIKQLINSIENFAPEYKPDGNKIDSYIDLQNQLGIDQILISNLHEQNGTFFATTNNNNQLELTANDVADIISNNTLKGNRAVYLGGAHDDLASLYPTTTFRHEVLGEIIRSAGMKMQIDKTAKNITFTQTRPSDWALVNGADLGNWNIMFIGNQRKEFTAETNQRFNFYGMTGCLNFYNVTFNETSITALRGQCEDSINIVSSKGNLKKIEVNDAYADAIDIDFSEVSIRSVNVINSGNDCFDVSSGNYILERVVASNCEDKGISVGEKSKLSADNVLINNAAIGISSKDSSITQVREARFKKVQSCYEATQKKQEFNGARLDFGFIECRASFKVDPNSRVSIGTK